MKKNLRKILAIALMLSPVGLIGCSDKNKTEADQAIQTMRHSFDQAPADLKAKFEDLVSAIQNNDLVKAKADLDQLSQAGLSPEQQQAVVEKKRELMVKLSAASQNGDATAGKMIQDLRSRSR